MREHDRCELCGETINLELHDIIPLTARIDGLDIDCTDNYVCVCEKCHKRLTPRRLLQRYGIERAKEHDEKLKHIKQFWIYFYQLIGEKMEETKFKVNFGGTEFTLDEVDACAIMDVFDYAMMTFDWKKLL